MKLALGVVGTLLLQRALGWPGIPPGATLILLPMPFIVASRISAREARWPWLGLAVGLGWDVMVASPVIGPGGIAWSAAGAVVGGVTAVVADRSAKMWFLLGGLGAAVVLVVQEVALLPLGLASPPHPATVATIALTTALWCAAVGAVRTASLAARWRRWRARKLH